MNMKQGFTLIELVVVLAIVAFLVVLSVPLASAWIRNAQLERDYAGIARALSTTKSLAMRNFTGSAAQGVFTPTAALCRANDTLVIFQRGVPNTTDQASCSRLSPTASNNKSAYTMGQDVAITFGANNQAFCGAVFDARGSMRLCSGANCATCETNFDPRDAGALKVVVSGADASTSNSDQTQFIRAF